MTNEDAKEFERLFTLLASIYGANVNPDIVEAYFDALKGFSLGAVGLVFNAARNECEFMPKPVWLRDRLSGAQDSRTPDWVTFKCLRCRDLAVILTDRYAKDGTPLGTFACPCICVAGEAVRAAWRTPNEKGHVIAEDAKRNTAMLVERGAIAAEEPPV